MLGAVNITMFATSNTLLQLQSDPSMRGRVLAVGGFVTLGAAAWLWASIRGRSLPPVDRDDVGSQPPPDVSSDPALA